MIIIEFIKELPNGNKDSFLIKTNSDGISFNTILLQLIIYGCQVESNFICNIIFPTVTFFSVSICNTNLFVKILIISCWVAVTTSLTIPSFPVVEKILFDCENLFFVFFIAL